MNITYSDGGPRRQLRKQQRETRRAQRRFMKDSRREARRSDREGRDVESPLRYGGGGMYYADGGMMGGDPRRMAMGRDPQATDNFFAQKGIEAELRKMARQERRAANREGRQTGMFPAEPQEVDFLLEGLGNDRFERERMVNKGFMNESARMLARQALAGLLGYGISQYSKTPKTVQRPIGASGQTYDVDLNALQRLGMMLGLGPD